MSKEKFNYIIGTNPKVENSTVPLWHCIYCDEESFGFSPSNCCTRCEGLIAHDKEFVDNIRKMVSDRLKN